MARCKGLVVVVLALLLVAQVGASGGAAAQGEGGASATPTVNIELILDSSGSMIETTDTGQTKMDAAKAALHQVIDAIPSKGTVNVGFRIYGHKGDNTDAAKATSCQASELKVPVKGVDGKSLLGAIDQAQPTGWTPIGRSLELAAKDFPSGGKNVVNTIVLVTDGTETCDADPCQVATTIHDGPSKAIVDVIGFGTTPDDQQTLGCITQNGGGQLLSAGNDQQLRSALFSVLEQLQVVVGADYIGGNAFSLLPPGEAGKLSVIAHGAVDPTTHQLPVVIRNNTGQDVVGPKVSVSVRDRGGTILGAGDAMNMQPFYLRAGGVAIGAIFFSNSTPFPDDATYAFKVSSTPLGEARFQIRADLDVVEANGLEDHIAGTVKNGSTKPIKGPMLLGAVCFDENGAVLNYNLGTSDIDQLAPGETQPFQVDVLAAMINGVPCPAFLIAGQGTGTPRLPEASPSKTAPSTTATASQLAPSPTAASIGSPASNASGATTSGAIPGIHEAADRNFEADPGSIGVASLSAEVARFSSAQTAEAGLPVMITRYVTAARARSTGTVTWSDPRPSSASKVGDQRVAETWTITTSLGGIEMPAALLAVRKGDLVYLFVTVGQGINPTQVLVELANSVISTSARKPATGGLKTGGLWDLLPTLDEVPAGLHVVNEIVPQDLGPIPASAFNTATSIPSTAVPAGTATSSATSAGSVSGQKVSIELADVAFAPDQLTIPANTPITLTLTNTGALPHNFSIDALKVSVDVAPGDTQETTITVPPGTYQFYCNAPGHKEAGMVGTLTAH